MATFFSSDGDSKVKIKRRINTFQEESETILKPANIDHYNTFMGGVDKKE